MLISNAPFVYIKGTFEVTTGISTDLKPAVSSSPLVRKLGALCLLSEEEIDFLEGLQNNTLNVDRGQDFIVENADLRTTFIVIEGWAIRYSDLSTGRRQILSYALPGDILGLHVNFRATTTYSASALTPLKLAAVDPRRVIEISQKFPIIAAGLSWCTAREFAILGDQAIRLGRLSARQRLAHLFLELWHRFALIENDNGNWVEIPMTQRDLADTLGMSLVHTNRSLKSLRDAGLVSVSKDYVRLNDIKALIEMSEFNPEHLTEFQL